MNRSVSAREFNRPSRSPQPRSIYLNQESTKRDNSTPFHSPYKDGKPNPNYHNPSFISSHLFYPQQMTQPGQNKYQIMKNLIPNCNDRKKEVLYKERLKRQASASALNKSHRNRQYTNSQVNKTRILRSNQPEALMKNELDNLQHYRQTIQQKKDRLFEISRKRNEEPDEPVYLQRHRLTPFKHSQSKQDENIEELTRQLRALRKEMKHPDNYNLNLDRLIIQNRHILLEQQQVHRRQSTMLGNILRQQMRLAKPLKERRWVN